MKLVGDNLSILFEYFGFKSKKYAHTLPKVGYDPDDPMPYYLDQSQRANYDGPFDEEGVPLYSLRGKTWYSITFVIPYCLGQLAAYSKAGDENKLTSAKIILDWLINQQQADGSWLNPFSPVRFGINSPYVSAMTQGLGISVLLRGAYFLKSEKYKKAAVAAISPFLLDVSQGGVTTNHKDGKFYEEFPSDRPHHVLNGFIFALWGLYDLVRFENNKVAHQLWKEGLSTIKVWLPRYDIGYWSLYHIPPNPPNPATVAYHNLHIRQLEVMYAITSENIFGEYSRRWSKYSCSKLNTIRSLPGKVRWLLSN